MGRPKLIVKWKDETMTLYDVAKREKVPFSVLQARYYNNGNDLAQAVSVSKGIESYKYGDRYYTIKDIASTINTSTNVIKYFLDKNNKDMTKALEDLETPKGRETEEKILDEEIKQGNKFAKDRSLYGDSVRKQNAVNCWYLLTDNNIPTIKDKLDFIYSYYGADNQKRKIIEEMLELKHAIINNENSNFIEELADVFNLVYQLRNGLNKQDKNEFNKVLRYKINRQVKRVLTEYEEHKTDF